MDPNIPLIEEKKNQNVDYLPPIPVMMRHPYIVASVRQYRSNAQNEQLQHHIVSESFIPMAPNLVKPPRKRRRPPFSYSSLIAQAILESENERMTLRDIYTWITTRYPALYGAEDTGWQVPKTELAAESNHRGKGGYWTIDPTQMEKFRNGAFAKGASASMRKKPAAASSPSPCLPDTPVLTAVSGTTKHSDYISNSTAQANNEPCPAMQIQNLLN
ncbi:hypothetical protein [Parasitella parasitica]|uniref:Fork-head domain-containing protein n=1 Tax=Parasitella parasitica TaxID=35722 RepID=A0A0B7MU06_9FUNG|nr:hypothetical protein [Parasitella parasitica]